MIIIQNKSDISNRSHLQSSSNMYTPFSPKGHLSIEFFINRITQTVSPFRKHMDEPCLLELEGLVVSRGTRSVLNDINFKLREGEVVVLVGPNGSGKTTFIESCTGTIPFMKGSLSYYSNTNDKTVIRNKDGRNSNIPQIGLTLQNDGICGEETVEEKLLSVLNIDEEDKNTHLIDSILSDLSLIHI